MVDTVIPVNSVSIVGCGDIGCRVAELLSNPQHAIQPLAKSAITGYARSSASLSRITQLGIGSQAFDLDTLIQEPLSPCPNYRQFHKQIVFYFAPPANEGTTDTRIRNWLTMLDSEYLPQRILYISTTGIYGDQQGKQVNELTTPNPQTDRARRRLDAEHALAEFAVEHSIEYVILRVPGIYGDKRLPRKRLIAKTPILLPAISPITNRIHEDDLAQICVTVVLNSPSGEIYNVSDGDTMTMSDYFICIAEYLNLPRPPCISWYEAETLLSEGMLSYLKESRLIDNTKLINNLGIVLKYPSLSDFLHRAIK